MRWILRLTFIMILALSGNTIAISASHNLVKIKGCVSDSLHGEKLNVVNVRTVLAGKGVVTKNNGTFSINAVATGDTLKITASGYIPKLIPIKPETGMELNILLMPSETQLNEVVVTPHNEKYSKKYNPAVDLMQTLRKAAASTDPTKEEYYSFEKYNKTLLGFNDFYKDIDGTKIPRQMEFIRNYVDTAQWTGRRILDLTLKEKRSTVISGMSAAPSKEIVNGMYYRGVDDMFNQANINKMLDDVLQEIDIYDNDINILQNRFVSPLSGIGADFYKYFITDTVLLGDDRCIELQFVPRNLESFGFNGSMYIPVEDSIRYVKRVSMRVSKDINLNYIDNIFINQNYILDSIGNRHKVRDEMCMELQIIPGTPRFYVRRFTGYENFSYDRTDTHKEFAPKLGNLFILDEADNSSPDFWNPYRMEPLSRAESRMGNFAKEMRKSPFLWWTERIIHILVEGYVSTGKKSKFDFGPVNTFISYNSLEGLRLRAGGMTTANLSKHLFARGYLAYGFHDRKWKYEAQLEYSFNEKKYHSREFPIHSLSISHRYDIDQLGERYLFTNQDNVFLSLKRMSSNLSTYMRHSAIEYKLELANNLSFTASVNHQIQEATHFVPFIDGFGNHFKRYPETYFNIVLRYAPNEKFIQGRSTRGNVNLDAPVITLSHDFGPKGFLNSRFCLNRTELSFRKRFWFSAFGFADVALKGGIIWSKVDYPALLWPSANISYIIQRESYSLMNPMEFANDKYAALDLTYHGNGILFNRIPYFKKLKLREIVTFKALSGGLNDRNNPEFNQDLFQFPSDAIAMKMTSTPYMEIGAGIDNIFTILRVDYVWRLTYRHNPGIDRHGLRIAVHFTF